jgi:hypothetical protein
MQNKEDVKQQYSSLFLEYNQKQHKIYLDGEDSEDYLLGEFDLEVFSHPEVFNQIPQPVRLAYEYYSDNVEGWPRLCKVPSSNGFSYAICETTDGDDGWLEIYDENGSLIACGRIYLELIGWVTIDEARGYVKTLDYPSILSDRRERTLWNN